MDKIKRHAHTVFVAESDHSLIQFIRYLFVGGFAAVVNASCIYFLTSLAGVHYLVSAAIAFIMGTIVNYSLSILWVFKSTGKLRKEITLFTVVGVTGLSLNELFMWLFVSKAHIFYMLSWAISTLLVLFWNFILRKKFVFESI